LAKAEALDRLEGEYAPNIIEEIEKTLMAQAGSGDLNYRPADSPALFDAT